MSAEPSAEPPKLSASGPRVSALDAWKRKAAAADKSGTLLAKLAKTAEAEQAMWDISQAAKRVKKIKPGADHRN